MGKESDEGVIAKVIAYQDKILRVIKEHKVLHYIQLNEMMGVQKKARGGEREAYTIALTGLRELGLLSIVSHKMQAGKGIGRAKGRLTSQFYCDPEYADIVFWARKLDGNLDTRARILLKMDEIAKDHPKEWIHYRKHAIHKDLIKQNLIKEKPYQVGGAKVKSDKFAGKNRYEKTKRFDTAVKVLKKVLDFRQIPY